MVTSVHWCFFVTVYGDGGKLTPFWILGLRYFCSIERIDRVIISHETAPCQSARSANGVAFLGQTQEARTFRELTSERPPVPGDESAHRIGLSAVVDLFGR